MQTKAREASNHDNSTAFCWQPRERCSTRYSTRSRFLPRYLPKRGMQPVFCGCRCRDASCDTHSSISLHSSNTTRGWGSDGPFFSKSRLQEACPQGPQKQEEQLRADSVRKPIALHNFIVVWWLRNNFPLPASNASLNYCWEPEVRSSGTEHSSCPYPGWSCPHPRKESLTSVTPLAASGYLRFRAKCSNC